MHADLANRQLHLARHLLLHPSSADLRNLPGLSLPLPSAAGLLRYGLPARAAFEGRFPAHRSEFLTKACFGWHHEHRAEPTQRVLQDSFG
jgi:hypothetical protein